MHTFLVFTLALCALSLVLRLMRLGEFLTWPRGAIRASDAIGDLAWALICGGVGALAAWLLVMWEL
ncbi:MAG: hypothetical protein LBI48_02090 [Burkholderiaceae bacterium]|jgi:hypothetical protein|nr:hypothetical protein [Burkholderiaceae bacterium]